VLQAQRLAIECRAARDADELAAHYAVRHRVFVVEQGIFSGSDRDPHDRDPATVHVVGLADGVVGGAVRLFPLDDAAQRWQGDRLAVLPGHRTHGLGAPLVRHAVWLAGASGGEVMIAHIQLPNVAFFLRLGWQRDGAVETYAGLPHQPMSIALEPGLGGAFGID
jgi:putative N-acetyltransferase (TIGR04045 family)